MPKVRTLLRVTWPNRPGRRSNKVKGLLVPQRIPSAQDQSRGDLNLSADSEGAMPSVLSLVKVTTGNCRLTREGEQTQIAGDVSCEKSSCERPIEGSQKSLSSFKTL